jgi:uncharacterized protein YyaL (SSP411 family)
MRLNTKNNFNSKIDIFYRSLLVLLVASLASCISKTNKTTKKEQLHTNDLIHETSPYLLQHAHNPVNWKAWNPATLELAKKENKLIIVSIGYSACHWCHVMEEESFENDSIAKLMNANFINIKVDREERPDIDQVYMNAVQLITGRGGWPLNCITLPDGRPIFAGTYFTKKQWAKVLTDVSTVYKNDPDKVIDYAQKLTEGIKNTDFIELIKEDRPFKIAETKKYVALWDSYLDHKNGGQKTDIKFPMPNNLAFQLRYSIQNGDEKLKNYVLTTLEKMAYGGIYDHVGGGFSRYSTDKKWHIPHFEKMLYDNAQLVSLYAEAYLVTKNELFREVVDETLTFVERELTNANGSFYSSLDADSKTATDELEEGAFYRWTKAELQTIITKDFPLFEEYYNINSYGKWEKDSYVLIRKDAKSDFAKKQAINIPELEAKIISWKQQLFNAREKRNRPRLDDKVLTSWNAHMLKGYANAYRVLRNPAYLKAAEKNAAFILENQLRADGGLYHNYKDGKSSIDGFAEDYAAVIAAFITLYQVTFNEAWLQKAKQLTDYTVTHFMDAQTQMFFFTTNSNLIARKTEITDNVISSSNSIMAHNLFQLSHYYSNSQYAKNAKQMLTNMLARIERSPSSYSNWLVLMSNYTNPYYEVAISGINALEKSKNMNSYYLPNILMAGATQESELPLMKNRFVENNTFIYVCIDGTCKLPETNTAEALKQLKVKR